MIGHIPNFIDKIIASDPKSFILLALLAFLAVNFRGEEIGARAPRRRPRLLRDVPADPEGDNGAPLHGHDRRLHRGTPPL